MSFHMKFVPLALGLCCVSGEVLAQQADDIARPVIVPTPPAGMAQVVFFRSSGMAGRAISCAIQENGAKIASLPPGRFFILVTSPGQHTYTAASSNQDHGIFFDLKPGEVKYVGCHIVPGLWTGKADLEIPLRDDAFATKMWKQVSPDRITSPNVLTAAQLSAALSSASAAAPASALISGATPARATRQPAPAPTPLAAPVAPPPAPHMEAEAIPAAVY